MSKAEVSYVQYFVPSDGDSEDHPNVFVVRKAPKVLTVADIVASFPLPGEYLFRAKMPFGKTHVWLDLNSGDETIPQFNTKFILKVSRISLGVAGVSKGGAGGGVAAAAAAAAVAPAPTSSARSSSGAGATAATPVATARAPAAPSSDASQQPRPAAPKAPEPQQRQQQEHVSDDLLGMLGSGSGSSSSSSSSSSSAPSTSRGFTNGGGGGGGWTWLGLAGEFLRRWGVCPCGSNESRVQTHPRCPLCGPLCCAPPPSKSATQAPPKPASNNILSGDIFSM